jgi:hypothetical protein
MVRETKILISKFNRRIKILAWIPSAGICQVGPKIERYAGKLYKNIGMA